MEGLPYLGKPVEKIDGTAAGFKVWPDTSRWAGLVSPCVDLSPLGGTVSGTGDLPVRRAAGGGVEFI